MHSTEEQVTIARGSGTSHPWRVYFKESDSVSLQSSATEIDRESVGNRTSETSLISTVDRVDFIADRATRVSIDSETSRGAAVSAES